MQKGLDNLDFLNIYANYQYMTEYIVYVNFDRWITYLRGTF